jgi:AGCS family alanine or glycine:cation symporter
METVKQVIDAVQNVIWNWPPQLPYLVVLLVGTGVFLTIRLRFIQIRKFRHSIEVIAGHYDDPEDEGDISHFQALSAALSATVGIGNIAGVATAIHYGGPGALFWMWVTAVFGMCTKYVECTLSHFYRVLHPDGSASGGPMYYIERGLGKRWKWLGVAFAALAIICSFGTGNSIQSFTVADSFRADLGIPPWITGLITSSIVALVILGGIRRIGQVACRLAPAMAIIYVAGGLIVLILNIDQIPGTFALIFEEAFTPTAGIGGFAGSTFMWTLIWGVKRGLFSNEAGQGSAPIAHAAAKTKESVREGTVAMIGPFVDTITICTITGLVICIMGTWHEKKMEKIPFETKSNITVIKDHGVILTNGEIDEDDIFEGTVDVQSGQAEGILFVRRDGIVEQSVILHDDKPFSGRIIVSTEGSVTDITDQAGGRLDVADVQIEGLMLQHGSPLTAWSFQRGLRPLLGGYGNFLVTLAVFLFALSTAISWSYYGDRSAQYLFGRRAELPYKVVYVVMHFLGAIFSLEVVWGFGDTALGLMSIPNLIAIVALSGVVVKLSKDYFSRKHRYLR